MDLDREKGDTAWYAAGEGPPPRAPSAAGGPFARGCKRA